MSESKFKDVREFRDGAVFDFNSVSGQFKWLFAVLLLSFLLWSSPEWLEWVDGLLGWQPHMYLEGEIELVRFWAWFFGVAGGGLTCLRILVLILAKRRRHRSE